MTTPAPRTAVIHDPERWRPEFPILASTTYLVSHSLGAMPSRAAAKLQEFAEEWATRGVRAWAEGWWDAPLAVGNLLGRIMNAPPDSVVMQPNVSIAQALVASCLDFRAGRDKVVTTDLEFPSNLYVWQGFARHGARVEVVPTDGVEADTQRLLEAIDERTAIVTVSHVAYKSHSLLDAAAVCARAREAGALVLLDTYQSLGTVPVDVQALGVDLVCGGSVKWLCGGPGAGWLYVRPDLVDRLEPLVTGWAAHAEPFAFEAGPQRYAPGVRRLLHGTPAVASLAAATAGYELVLAAGVEAIRAWSLRLTERLRGKLLEQGFALHGPARAERRGGTLTVRLRAGEDGPAFVRALEARGALVDHRPGAGIRVSPHFYTLEDEVDEFVELLAELRHRETWREHAGARADH